MTNAGPLDALIEFVDPVTYVPSASYGLVDAYSTRVTWDGHDIATIALPSGKLVEASYTSNAHYDLQCALLRTPDYQTTTHMAS